MTDGRDVPGKDECCLGRNLGSLDVGVKGAQFPFGYGVDESLSGGLIGCVCLRSAGTNSSCSLKLQREGGADVLRSGPEGVEKCASRVLTWSGVGRLIFFDALGVSFHPTIPNNHARTDVSLDSISH